MPALAFSLAMLARLGPLDAVEDDFWIPALALAEDQMDPKASPDGLAAAGLGPDVVDVAEVKDDVDCMLGLALEAAEG